MGAGLLAQPCSLQLGPDTVLCDVGTLVLQVPLGALSFTWNTGSTASQITVSSTGDYWCEAVFPQNNANQIQNGDFTQGATAFSSDYVPGTGGVQVPLSAVVQVSERPAMLAVNHVGQFPAATVSFNLAPGVALGDAVDAIRAAEAGLGLPASIETRFQGAALAFQASLTSTLL